MHPAIPVTAIVAIAALEVTALLTHTDGALLGFAIAIIAGIAGYTIPSLLQAAPLPPTIKRALRLPYRTKDGLPF
jgi:hypothetical protein